MYCTAAAHDTPRTLYKVGLLWGPEIFDPTVGITRTSYRVWLYEYDTLYWDLATYSYIHVPGRNYMYNMIVVSD